MTAKTQSGLCVIDTEDGAVAQLYRTKIGDFRRSKGLITLNSGGFHTQSTVKALNTFLEHCHVKGRARIIRGLIRVDVGSLETTLVGEHVFDLHATDAGRWAEVSNG